MGAPIGATIGGALLFGAAGFHLEAAGTELARVSLLGAALGALAYIDLTQHRIPNRIVFPASAACAVILSVEILSPGTLEMANRPLWRAQLNNGGRFPDTTI